MLPQQYCLRWKHHHSNVQNMFSQLLEKERFCDVTLYCSLSFGSQLEKGAAAVDPDSIRGVSLRAHRVVLASCSELLGSLLGAHESAGEPVLVIDGAEPSHVRALLRYMYTGEMCVHRSQLQSLLKTAEELKIKGLTDIRWSNKDEPPDCQTDAVSATPARTDMKTLGRPAGEGDEGPPAAPAAPAESRGDTDRYTVNGGPPPLIKLPSKERIPQGSPGVKRDAATTATGGSDTEENNTNPKRPRTNTSNDQMSDNEDHGQEWRHGNMNITAERVVQWGGARGADGSVGSPESLGGGGGAGDEDDDAEDSDEPWGDAPADIGSFLHTRLTVDGDNSDDESNECAPPSTSSSIDLPAFKTDLAIKQTTYKMNPGNTLLKPSYTSPAAPATVGPKSGPTDPRFTDVIKLSDYLRVGRRPQFWEEDFVKRVMEAIRLKELEMKQAAEILGVSYGTLYGRYRDAYGCINRPFRTARELWSSKSASEVLDRLKRGDIPMDVAAQALGCSARDLYVHYHDIQIPDKEFEPIPIEIDPSLRMKSAAFASAAALTSSPSAMTSQGAMTSSPRSKSHILSAVEMVVKRALEETGLKKANAAACSLPAGRWRMPSDPGAPSADPTSPTSPTLLMKSRPDLTIVAAKRSEPKAEPAPKAEREPKAERDPRAEDENQPENGT